MLYLLAGDNGFLLGCFRRIGWKLPYHIKAVRGRTQKVIIIRMVIMDHEFQYLIIDSRPYLFLAAIRNKIQVNHNIQALVLKAQQARPF